MNSFNIPSSPSGCSSFISSLLYSQVFDKMLATIAGDTDNAGEVFQNEYTAAWFSKAEA